MKPEELQKLWLLRKVLTPMGAVEAMEFILDNMRGKKDNAEFLRSMNAKG